MIDDQELISGLNSAIERLLGGDPAVAVEEDVDIEIRPYVEIFALLLEEASDPARPEFRASLRERFVGGAEVPGRQAGALGRIAAFAAATFILGSAVNPVLARSLVASISETMGEEVAGAVNRILDLGPDHDITAPTGTDLTESARGGVSIDASTLPLPISAVLPPAEGLPSEGSHTAPVFPSTAPGFAGEHPLTDGTPPASATSPAPATPADLAPRSGAAPGPGGSARTDTPDVAMTGSPPTAPSTDPPAALDETSPDAAPVAAPQGAATSTTDAVPPAPEPDRPGKGNAYAVGGSNSDAGGQGNRGPQQGSQPGNSRGDRGAGGPTDAVQGAGTPGGGVSPLGRPNAASPGKGRDGADHAAAALNSPDPGPQPGRK